MSVSRWILKSLITRESRLREAQREIKKKVEMNTEKWFSTTFQVSSQLFASGSTSCLSTSFSSFHHPSRSVGHASRVPFSAFVPNRDEWGRDRNQQQTQWGGASRRGGRGARASPLFLDWNEARREAPPSHPPPPTLSDGLDPLLQCHMWCECCFPSLLRLNVWVFSANSCVSLFHKIEHVQFLIVRFV